jgi:hypothetical protein
VSPEKGRTQGRGGIYLVNKVEIVPAGRSACTWKLVLFIVSLTNKETSSERLCDLPRSHSCQEVEIEFEPSQSLLQIPVQV